jgi:hypothetical protein
VDGFAKREIYVSKTGSDTNAGTEASPVLTIAKAIALSKPNGYIYV